MAPLIIGLTGGIGSGKSTICQQFISLGVPVINTDLIAREVVKTGQPALQALQNHFGTVILNTDGSLNRTELRKIIFNDLQQKNFVEKLLHPLIMRQLQLQLADITAPYVIIEIPLLIEAGWQSQVDQILVVDLPEELQIERLKMRSELDKKSLKQIINSQISRSERVKHADQLIDNSGNPGEISQQVSELHQRYLQLAQKRHK